MDDNNTAGEQVLVSLSVDSAKVEKILDDYKTGEIGMFTARDRINNLYEYNARNFQLKLNLAANRMMEETLAIMQAGNEQMHMDLQDLIEVMRNSK